MKPQFETDIAHACGLRYRIQKTQASDGVWHQRHIWYKDQLGAHDPPIAEKWIVADGPPEYHYRPATVSERVEEIFNKTSFEF